jgi:hypothetical protein
MNPLRRKFLSGAGVIGGLAAGLGAAKLTVEVVEKKQQAEDISHLAPEPNTTLTLAGDNRTAEEKAAEAPKGNGNFVFHPNPQITNQVSLAVGKDDRLWIKVGDSWKRVSIDA